MFSRRDPAERAGHTTPDVGPFGAPGGLIARDAPHQDGPSSRRAMTRQEVRDALDVELLNQVRLLTETMTDAFARGGFSQLVNDVLDVRTDTFDSTGTIVRDYRTGVGSVFLVNLGTAAVTVQAGTAGGSSAPAVGRGLTIIPAGGSSVVAIASHAFTLWGTAGQSVSYQVFTKPLTPSAGPAGSAVTVSSSTTPVRPGVALDTSATAAAGAAATATLAAAAGRTTWVTGFVATWAADGTGTVNDTITVTAGGTVLTYKVTTVAGAGGQLVVTFPAPIPATAANTAVTVAIGGTLNRAAITLDAHGFQL